MLSSIEGERHGVRVVRLPCDFLCRACSDEFPTLDVAALSDEEVAEWAARMQYGVAGVDFETKRSFLVDEQQRCLGRRRAMAAAAAALAIEGSQRGHFECFKEALSPLKFARADVEPCLARRARLVLACSEYHVGGVDDKCVRFQKVFGVDSRDDGHDKLWWASAVPLDASPTHWTGYTGKPRYCAEKLWLYRMWAIALGGFHKMHGDLQRLMLRLGGVTRL